MRLVSVDTLAAKLEISPATIRDWVFERRIPFVKVGRSVRFDEGEIEAWVSQGKKAQLR